MNNLKIRLTKNKLWIIIVKSFQILKNSLNNKIKISTVYKKYAKF